MDDNATTLVLVIGYLGKSDPARAATMHNLEESLRARGKPFAIIGDGTYAPTLQEIRARVQNVSGPVEVLLDAHGEKIPADAGMPELGNYAVTLSDGRPAGAQPIGDLPDGSPLNRNQVVNITDFFKAMPSNVTGVMLGTCYSEAALPYTDLLPAHARLFVTSGVDSTTLTNQSYRALSVLANLSDIVPDGSSLTETYGFYLASFRNSIKYKDGEWQGNTPSRFAISGEGSIDLASATRNLKGYHFPDVLLNDVAARIAPNAGPENQAKMVESFRAMAEQITSGSVIGNQSAENRAYNFIISETARRAEASHIPMGEALRQMEAEAATARGAQLQSPAASVDVKALGSSLRDQFAHLQQGGASAAASHQTIAVPTAAQSQNAAPAPSAGAAR